MFVNVQHTKNSARSESGLLVSEAIGTLDFQACEDLKEILASWMQNGVHQSRSGAGLRKRKRAVHDGFKGGGSSMLHH